MHIDREREVNLVELRVAGTTNTKELAKAVSSNIREGKQVVLVGIGANAMAQAIKCVPIVNGNLASKGLMYTILPAYEDRPVRDEESDEPVVRTVLVMRLVRYTFV